METVRVIHDRAGHSLTLWFGDPSCEITAAADEHGVIVMKDPDGRVIGVEILNYVGDPAAVSLSLSNDARTAKRV
jgi:hypothetical protein